MGMDKIRITQLDLFSGIGGFHLGFERAGYEVETYFSEIDKYAIDVYQNNFKNSKYVGSVTDVYGRDLPRIDLITFGSPCQDFSLAGKRKGMQGNRSSLISEAIRLISECRPSLFVWENVKGTFSSNNGEDFWAIIQAFANIGGYRLEWQLLNTKWFLPQNRERIYLVGYSTNTSGGQVFPISENDRAFNGTTDRANTCTLTARYNAIGTGSYINELYKVSSATKQGYEEARIGDSINLSVPTSKTRRGRVGKGQAQTLDTHCNQAVIGYSRDKKGKVISHHEKNECNTLHASSGTGNNTDQYIRQAVITHNIPEIVSVRKYDVDIKALQVLLKQHKNKTIKQISEELNTPKTQVEHWFRNDNSFSIPPKEIWYDLKKVLSINDDSFDKSITTYEERESTYEKTNRVYDTKGIAPTLTSTSADERILTTEIGDYRADEGYRKRKDGDSPTLNARARQDISGQPIVNKIRRLTPIECERLQGFPDNWTKQGAINEISDSQRYKMCGNAVTVDVVQAVAEKCKFVFQ